MCGEQIEREMRVLLLVVVVSIQSFRDRSGECCCFAERVHSPICRCDSMQCARGHMVRVECDGLFLQGVCLLALGEGKTRRDDACSILHSLMSERRFFHLFIFPLFFRSLSLLHELRSETHTLFFSCSSASWSRTSCNECRSVRSAQTLLVRAA